MKNKNFSAGQIQWARSHDWFIWGGKMEIVCLNQWSDGSFDYVTHTSFESLRDWAGY